MEKITVERIEQGRAAAVLEAAAMPDPARQSTPASIAGSGECFRLTADGSEGVFVLQRKGAGLWVSGAGAVQSKGLTGTGLQVVEQIAKQSDCQTVGFQTGRPGLVKLARKQGYRVVGFIMEKSV